MNALNDLVAAGARIQLLAISGSLRSVSSNTTILQAIARLVPSGVTVRVAPSVGALPHFNPDLDAEGAEPPPAVASFRAGLRAADGVLISAPEYAHGVPGSLKNALDRVVGTGEFMHKPVALINASATSSHAQNALVETLTIMMAEVMMTRVPIASNKITLDAILADQSIAHALRQVVEALVAALIQARTPKPEG